MCLGLKPLSTSRGIAANLKKKRAGKKSLTRRKLHSGSLTKQGLDGLTNTSPGMPRPHAAQIEPGSAGVTAGPVPQLDTQKDQPHSVGSHPATQLPWTVPP